MPRNLTLALKGEFFDAIVAGKKPLEYRERTPYWAKRLVGREYDTITLTRGYPAANDTERRLVLPWRGYVEQEITHSFFGADPVPVYAINVENFQPQCGALAGEPEILGERCLDGGACHHACEKQCFRRECCVPLTLSGYTAASPEWRLQRAPKP